MVQLGDVKNWASKNVNNKRCATKLIFFNLKKKEKDLMIFDVKNDLESQNKAAFGKIFG